MLRRTGPTPRAGFTLIELLVVIAIIVLLVALTLAGIGYARNSARTLQTTNDIRGLDEAVTAFKAKFGFAPPSHIFEQGHVRQFRLPTRIDQPEYLVFRRMYPRWDPVNQSGVAVDLVTILPNFQPTPPPGVAAGAVLDNNQVMVYFLAGPTNQGWSNAGPYAPTGNTKNNPFFEFPVGDQLVASPGGAPRFLDQYGVPYAYFTSNTDNDRFNERCQFPWTPGSTQVFPWSGGTPIEVAPVSYDPTTDTMATKTAHPLMSPGGKWLAAGRWQIISAGKDKKFGYGSPMLPTAIIAPYTPGGGDYQQKQNGDDDLSNFVTGLMGAN